MPFARTDHSSQLRWLWKPGDRAVQARLMCQDSAAASDTHTATPSSFSSRVLPRRRVTVKTKSKLTISFRKKTKPKTNKKNLNNNNNKIITENQPNQTKKARDQEITSVVCQFQKFFFFYRVMYITFCVLMRTCHKKHSC